MKDRPASEPCGKAIRLDRLTLEQVYRSEAPRLARYFRKQLHGGHDALDLVHEAFLRLAKSQPGDKHRHPAAYLQCIARNLLLDRFRQSASRGKAIQVPIEDALDVPVPAEQEYGIDTADMLSAYRGALAQLPARTREVFILHRVDEMTYREIAKQLAITIPTVQYHVARALFHIDKSLDRT